MFCPHCDKLGIEAEVHKRGTFQRCFRCMKYPKIKEKVDQPKKKKVQIIADEIITPSDNQATIDDFLLDFKNKNK